MRLENLSKWTKLGPEGVLALQGEDKRRVKVEVNVAVPTSVHCVAIGEDGEPGEPIFLGIVERLDEVRFTAEGPCELWFSTDDEVWYSTTDGLNTALERPEQVSFTKIEERQSTNPELALMPFRAKSAWSTA